MEKSDFDRLLEQYLNGTLGPEETRKLEAWLETTKTRTGDSRLSKEDEDRIFKQITSKTHIDTPIEYKGAPFTRYPWRIAAAFLLLATVGFLVSWLLNPVITNNNQAPEKMILADGSIVWLKNGATLAYSENANLGTRHSQLSGEAFFEVAKDTARPFIIDCNGIQVKVLGTSFNLKSTTEIFEIQVLTGKVSVRADDDNVDLQISANEQLALVPGGDVRKIPLSKKTSKAITSGTQFNMNFNDARLSDVLNRIENKFDVKILLDDSRAAACRITADFTDNRLETTLNMITHILNVSWTRVEGQITITGTGC